MLLIVTIGLVLAGVVLLVVGFLTNSLGYIYAAIVCAAIAGVALIVFSRLTRRRATRLAMAGAGGDTTFLDGRGTASPGPAATPPEVPGREAQPERVPAGAGVADHGPGGAGDGATEGREHAPPEAAGRQPEPEPAAAVTAERPVVAAAQRATASPPGAPDGASDDASDDEDVFGDWDDDLVFPIEDYDELQVSQILPLLDKLEPDELEDVRDREQHGPHRDAVLQRIGGLLGEPAAAPGAPAPPASAGAPPSASSSADSAPTPPARDWPAPDHVPTSSAHDWPAPAGAPTPAAAPAPPSPAPPAPPAGEPIPGYATMRISDILSHLNDLSPEQLAAVEAQERAGSRRSIVLTRITKLRAQG